jgi:S-adenosylmethionine:tRNA ribosyltransferase-isomerase
MKTALFDYRLPPELVAQEPLSDRSASRLMVVDRSTARIRHLSFTDLPSLLQRGDCMVVNSSRVFPGRLEARKRGSGGRVELLLLERQRPATWLALAGGAGVRPGVELEIADGAINATVLEKTSSGRVLIRFWGAPEDAIDRLVLGQGEVPLPPYIKGRISDPERYQTVYSEREIAAAAPTAGLHFTEELLERVKGAGVTIAGLELAVGMDTFTPVREEEVEEHEIHSEWFSVPEGCASKVNVCKGRVVAVGTTVVRALESATVAGQSEAPVPAARVAAAEGRTSLFIKPGYRFGAVDAIITNFHFPRSTLLMLVCAFGGTELVLEAYREAIAAGYRFYSFGDAMLVT